MKMILNKYYGGFDYNNNVADKYEQYANNLEDFDPEIARVDPHYNEYLITVIEEMLNNDEDVNTEFSNLTIVEIPDEATDYIIDEYDGFEFVTYVVDGKLYRK